MSNPSSAGKVLKRLASETHDAVTKYSAGEMSRGRNWGFFVKNLPRDHTLIELAREVFDAMSEEQKKQFRGRIGT